jgi:hypothetical protein
MSKTLPVISGKKLISVLASLDYEVVRQRGSHVRLEKSDYFNSSNSFSFELSFLCPLPKADCCFPASSGNRGSFCHPLDSSNEHIFGLFIHKYYHFTFIPI